VLHAPGLETPAFKDSPDSGPVSPTRSRILGNDEAATTAGVLAVKVDTPDGTVVVV
jgi:hypothetical protein